MDILFVTLAWPRRGERNLYTDLFDEFTKRKNKIYVAGTSEQADDMVSELSLEKGISVLRIQVGKIRKTSHLRKALSLLTLNAKLYKGIERSFKNKNFDLIIGSTPSVTLSTLYLRLKKKYNAPFYLLLKDIWPQGSVDLKVLNKYSLPWLWLRTHEKRIYQTADYIGCMSPMGREYILSKNRYLPRCKVEVCPNTINPHYLKPDKNSREIRTKYNIPDEACVFIFSGNLGIGHGLAFLVTAIKQLSDYKKAYFIIGGSGTQYKILKKGLVENLKINAFLYEWLPPGDFSKMLMACDVGLILLHKYTVPQFPSRLLSYFDYSKAVLCAVNQYTDIGDIIDQNGCGKTVVHGDIEDFIDKIKYLSENVYLRKEMGKLGRDYLLKNYTVEHSYQIIMNHFR